MREDGAMQVWTIAGLAAGMAILVVGAEALVRGASRIAAAAGVSSLVIGLTVVAFGTSAPELAVSVGSALSGTGGVAVGNAVGSNIFNVLAILGFAALFGGLVVHQRIVRLDVPLLIVLTGLVWWFAADGRIAVWEGALLLVGIVAYTAFSYVVGRRETPAIVEEYDEAFGEPPEVARKGVPAAVGLVLVGLAALVGGAQLLVDGATTLAESLGVSDLVIGLTVVAAGTSLPELATSVVAARKGERDIAVGNIVGSNIFNLLAVLGAAAIAGGGLEVPRRRSPPTSPSRCWSPWWPCRPSPPVCASPPGRACCCCSPTSRTWPSSSSRPRATRRHRSPGWCCSRGWRVRRSCSWRSASSGARIERRLDQRRRPRGEPPVVSGPSARGTRGWVSTCSAGGTSSPATTRGRIRFSTERTGARPTRTVRLTS
jgi:cation:H+ antiporter